MASPHAPIPSVRDMLKSHTLAAEIIARDDRRENEILDEAELVILDRFCAQPGARDEILRNAHEAGIYSGAEGGQTSLACYVVAQHGTARPALLDEEIERLRAWFRDR